MRDMAKDFGTGHKFPRKGNEDHQNHLKTIEKHIKLHKQDWRNAVVVNMHPFAIQAHFGDAGLLTIKKCDEGKPYNAQTIDMYRITKADHGGGKYEPIEILPVEQAQEITRKYGQMGGVFWFYADEAFPAEAIKQSRQKQLSYYHNLVMRARDEWARTHTMVRISAAMRQAAKYLAKYDNLDISGYEWLDKPKLSNCPQCGEDRNPQANVCRHCDYPLNPTWVLKHRKDLATKYGLTASDAIPEAEQEALDESLSNDDTLLGAVQ